jgi:alpha-glucoside transport system substrate-binding protein
MKKYRWLIVVVVVFAMIAAACGGDDDETTTTEAGATTTAAGGLDMSLADFTVFGAPTGAEGDAMSAYMDIYNGVVGSDISYVGSDDFESQLRIRVDGGDPPAVAFTPQPGSICKFVDEGAPLVSLEDLGMDLAELDATRSKAMMDLAVCSDGKHYGLPWFPNYKSLIWYHEPTFQAEGYEFPATWEDLIALSSQMVDDGYAPWCFGFESGGATGWPGTDWIEDILARTEGVDYYFKWTTGEIPFTDPGVKEAFETFGEILFPEGYVLGGADNVASIAFKDAPLPLFNDPPSCLMHKQGSFVTNFFPEGGEETVKFFPTPTIDGNNAALGGGDTIMVFENSPEVAQVLTDWMSPDWACTLASPGGGGVAKYGGHGVAGVERLPGHKDVDPNCYETEINKQIAPLVTAALADNVFFFDGGDLMDPAVGQGTFWTGMVEFSRGADLDQILADIEAGWPS